MKEILSKILLITEFPSRHAKAGIQKAISLEKLIALLSSPRFSPETMEEYLEMDKERQANLKDVGGFILGTTNNNGRTKDSILTASGLAFDIDDSPVGIIEEIKAKANFFFIIYTTRKHRPEAPRFRLVIPFCKEIAIEQREPVARMVAHNLGILNDLDVSCLRSSQMMYYPSCCSDGEFLFLQGKVEKLLDPDEILANYQDWKNVAEYPMAESEKAKVRKFQKKITPKSENSQEIEDPGRRPGFIGAFCRAHSISSAIDNYLQDIYAPGSMTDRYSLVAASSENGLVVFDDTWAFSHHSTDAIHGECVNAYDLVRIHLFGELDADAKDGTPMSRMPSVLAMNAMIEQDSAVKTELLIDYGLLDEDGNPSEEFDFDAEYPDEVSKTAQGGETIVDGESHLNESCPKGSLEILTNLKLTPTGKVANVPENYALILEKASECQGIAFNQLSCRLVVKDRPNWKISDGDELTNADIASLKTFMSKNFGLYSAPPFDDALTLVAHTRAYNPIVNYLEQLVWDGTPRLEKIFVNYLGAEDTTYTREVSKLFFLGTVARAHAPGCKFDCMLILVGPQGVGKSHIFKVLAGPYFSDSLQLTDMADGKKAAEKLQGFWILEVPELAGMDKADQLELKAFLTSESDTYRAAYARVTETHPRRCVFVGTTNDVDGFLRDPTGGRRYLPIRVKGGTIDSNPFTLKQEEVDQMWAEANFYYHQGYKLFLEGEAAAMAAKIQRQCLVADARTGLVELYLNTKLPQNWTDLNLVERRRYLENPIEGLDNLSTSPFFQRDEVCNMEIACEVFGYGKNVDRKLSREIGLIMSQIEGWEPAPNKLDRGPLYGRQRGYVRRNVQNK